MIMADISKDYHEANSPIVREAAWKWYTTVVKTRLQNNSQALIVFTRWHEDVLIGRIDRSEEVVDFTSWEDLNFFFFFFNDPAPPEFSPLPLPAPLPI